MNNATITPSKDEGDSVTKLCGTVKPGAVTYTYALSGNTDLDITDPAGLFALSQSAAGDELSRSRSRRTRKPGPWPPVCSSWTRSRSVATRVGETMAGDFEFLNSSAHRSTRSVERRSRSPTPRPPGSSHRQAVHRHRRQELQEHQERRMSEAVTVVGLDRFDRTASHAADELRDLADTNRRAGDRVADKGRANAPKVSGNLARSVRVLDATTAGVNVGSDVVYARVIHNGWAAHNIRANPFLARAVD